MEEKIKYLFLFLTPLIGAVMLLLGAIYKYRLKKRIKGWIRKTGIVIRFETRTSISSEGSGIHYVPVVRYEVNGNTYTVESSSGGIKPKDTEVLEMDILYDPLNPSNAFVVRGYYVGPNIIVGIGAGFLFVGTVVVLGNTDLMLYL